ncbi:hypothetical protein H4R34_003967 [Dimargaris verticillata]|uniref:Uncharacterized protein n=1 Tax=Dimargaris verticillata TaxID=2761393 RepID=A0A9W8EBJ8_9FUNG|nr:hypothetical protein H4R34_003967 [Dimargaris verticillata]
MATAASPKPLALLVTIQKHRPWEGLRQAGYFPPTPLYPSRATSARSSDSPLYNAARTPITPSPLSFPTKNRPHRPRRHAPTQVVVATAHMVPAQPSLLPTLQGDILPTPGSRPEAPSLSIDTARCRPTAHSFPAIPESPVEPLGLPLCRDTIEAFGSPPSEDMSTAVAATQRGPLHSTVTTPPATPERTSGTSTMGSGNRLRRKRQYTFERELPVIPPSPNPATALNSFITTPTTARSSHEQLPHGRAILSTCSSTSSATVVSRDGHSSRGSDLYRTTPSPPISPRGLRSCERTMTSIASAPIKNSALGLTTGLDHLPRRESAAAIFDRPPRALTHAFSHVSLAPRRSEEPLPRLPLDSTTAVVSGNQSRVIQRKATCPSLAIAATYDYFSSSATAGHIPHLPIAQTNYESFSNYRPLPRYDDTDSPALLDFGTASYPHGVGGPWVAVSKTTRQQSKSSAASSYTVVGDEMPRNSQDTGVVFDSGSNSNLFKSSNLQSTSPRHSMTGDGSHKYRQRGQQRLSVVPLSKQSLKRFTSRISLKMKGWTGYRNSVHSSFAPVTTPNEAYNASSSPVQ